MLEEEGDVAGTPRDVATNQPKYSSVVYFHGMGNQRRYEETSRLVDCLDRYLGREHRTGKSVGILRNIKVRVEPLRSDAPTKNIVGYIRTVFSSSPEGGTVSSVRFYEGYWAPVMASNKSAWGVAKWMLRQPLQPWRTLRSPWRERQRLRRASLVALFERDRAGSAQIQARDYTNLMRLYNDFEGLSAQRAYPDGTFDEFLSYVAERSKARPETAQRRRSLAQSWYAAYRDTELRNAGLLAVLVLAIGLLVVSVLFGILVTLQWAIGLPALAALFAHMGEPPKANWSTVLAIATGLASLVGIAKFLTDYLGDVEAWATYEETDPKHIARNKVMDQSIEILTHVLSDPACERVTIVAHSLGTSIAHDALLALTRRNRAWRPEDPNAGPVPLHKIEHFVTMGSPIDKIEYFFESYSSTSHRYRRVVEALRGDIGSAPFTRNRRPHIHWINFWDQGDAISGALHSPASAVEFCQRVDNVHVASLRFPAPGASHSGYFTNRTVIDTLFKVIYLRAWSFRTLQQPGPNLPYDFESVHLGPGEPLGSRSLYAGVAISVPLLALLGLAAWLLGATGVGYAAGAAALAGSVFLLGGYIVSRAAHRRTMI